VTATRLAVALLASALAGCAEAGARATPPEAPAVRAAVPGSDSVVFAGGCFWGVQAVFQRVKGVRRAVSGYAGGTRATADYETVSSGQTGHAESVQVVFDPSVVSFGELLTVFFAVVHDPTQRDRQGPDVGPQYRSAIFVRTDDQRLAAASYVRQLDSAHTYGRPIVTQVARLNGFWAAEEYHQDYFTRHPDEPYIVYNDAPKVAHLQRRFPALYVAYTPR
jgi:peptide-methionine (S)-S-oxide reductase